MPSFSTQVSPWSTGDSRVMGCALLSAREGALLQPAMSSDVPWWAAGPRLPHKQHKHRDAPSGGVQPTIKKIRLVWSDKHANWRCASPKPCRL